MADIKMNLVEYKDSLIGGLMDAEEVTGIVEEMKNAKVGTIKANCWEKTADDEYIIYSL